MQFFHWWAGLCLAAAACGQSGFQAPLVLIAVDAGQPPAVYVSTGKGLLRSADGGLNWRAVLLRPAGERQPVVTALVADPAPGSRTIYVGTDAEEGGVLKSTDGITFTPANLGLPAAGETVRDLVVLRRSPQTVFARMGSSIYRSLDGGAQWALRGNLGGEVTAFAVAPTNPDFMVAAAGTGVYSSVDGGARWILSPNALPISRGTTVRSLVFDVADPQIITLAASGGPAGSGQGIYRSSDRGVRFARVALADPVRLVADESDPRILYSTTLEPGNVYRSRQGGSGWERLEVVAGAVVGGLALSPRTPATVWAATARGPYVSEDRAEKWVSKAGLVQPSIYSTAPALDFWLYPGETGQVELRLLVNEGERWSIPLDIQPPAEAWLSFFGAPSSQSPVTVQLRVSARGLDPGEYRGALRVIAPQAANSAMEIAVRLTVRVPASRTAPWRVVTVAGSGQAGRFGDGGPAVQAGLTAPESVAAAPDGAFFVSDSGNNDVRRVGPDGRIARYAGRGDYASAGDGGAAAVAALAAPRGIALGPQGELYVSEGASRKIRRVDAEGTITTYATGIEEARGLATDSSGNLYVAQPGAHAVVRIGPDGVVTRVAGTGQPGYSGDGGDARRARLAAPRDVALDGRGNLLIADTENHRVRLVSPDGRIRTVAGTGVPGYQGDGPEAARLGLSSPQGVAASSDGAVYIADTGNQRIRMIAPEGGIRTIAGTGTAGFAGDGGPASEAQFREPVDVVLDAAGGLLVVDSQNRRVRRLTPPPPSPPRIASGGITNAGDRTARFAPGGLIYIAGTALAAGEHVSPDELWPVAVAGTSVSIGGVAAPLGRVSPGLILAQIPYEVAPGPAAVQVTRDGVDSEEVIIEVAGSAPAFLEDEPGRLLARNEDGSANSPDRPAAPESRVVFYLTGVGPVDPPVASGVGAPGDPQVRPLSPVSAKVGEAPAEVEIFLLPGFVGIAQATLRVPAGTAPGDQPVVVVVGEAATPASRLAVGAVAIPETPLNPGRLDLVRTGVPQ